VVDLDDEYADTDIPTTLIRSKADCPTMEVPTKHPGCLTALVRAGVAGRSSLPGESDASSGISLSGTDDADHQ